MPQVVSMMGKARADTLEGLIDSYIEEFGETLTAAFCNTASTTLHRWRALRFRQLDEVQRDNLAFTLREMRENFRIIRKNIQDLHRRRQ